jgi:hypothetical protein
MSTVCTLGGDGTALAGVTSVISAVGEGVLSASSGTGDLRADATLVLAAALLAYYTDAFYIQLKIAKKQSKIKIFKSYARRSECSL